SASKALAPPVVESGCLRKTRRDQQTLKRLLPPLIRGQKPFFGHASVPAGSLPRAPRRRRAPVHISLTRAILRIRRMPKYFPACACAGSDETSPPPAGTATAHASHRRRTGR